MSKPVRRHQRNLATIMVEMSLAASETIAHRTLLMAQGRCTPAEYWRMVSEKMIAAQQTSELLMRPVPNLNMANLLAPWHGAVTRNARRLRKQ
jgi:ABC-type dipeptide/oligopeptide/nickel transport system ATPase subunit